MKKLLRTLPLLTCALLLGALPAWAQAVSFSDPTGDDNGPGGYTYPTDAVYKAGSFDLTKLEVNTKGDKVEFEVSVGSNLDDPWRMGVGFSVQMVFIFIDTDGKEGGGFTDSPPGLNVAFAPASAWEKCVILSPQAFARVSQEIEAKGGAMKGSLLAPNRVRGSGRTLSGSVSLSDLGGGDPATWGYQVVMQSNEGFPADNDLLTRKVNEFEGQHRFGGGTDGDCDPHVMDVLGEGQAAMLAYECNADGSSKKKATLTMVRKG